MPDEKKKGVIPHIGGFKEEKKTGMFERYLNRFFNKQSMESLARGFLYDFLIGGINRMFNGSNVNPSQQAFTNLTNNYSQMFRNNLFQQQQIPTGIQQLSNYDRNVFPVESRVKALQLVDAINEAIRREGKVRITDVNEATDKPDNDWTDNDYGWYSIEGYQIQPQVFGSKVLLILPLPVKIKNM